MTSMRKLMRAKMKLTITLSILLLLSSLALSFLVVDYQGRLQDAGAIVEEQKTDLLTRSLEVSQLNSELTQRDTEVNQLGAELTTALKEADYWEGKAHPRQFNSVEELKAWLAGNDIDKREYIEFTYDCDDFAQDLMLAALEDGYLISTELWSCHMLNSTIIGNNIYTIEPMTDGVQFVGKLDTNLIGDNQE
jgi:hypothetical protein